MNNSTFKLAAQSTYFKLKRSTSKDSGIFLDNTIYESLIPFFSGQNEKGHNTIDITIFREDCIRALGNIMCSLPLFSSVAGVPKEENNVVEIYNTLSKEIDTFFGENESAILSSLYFTDLQGRKYLWGTEGKKRPFELRKFFVANHTELFFNTEKGHPVILRFNTHVVRENKEEFEPFNVTSIPANIEDSHQIIYYGAPGTGKSHKIKKMLGEYDGCPEEKKVPKQNIFRTTFHPDSDYSTFVGAYKPTKDKKPLYGLFGDKTIRFNDGGDISEDVITYKFVPQAFLKAYVRAYEVPDEKVYLVIEEINRGNCAQIFGDLFQLLDRDGNGKSDYTIKGDDDLKTYLEDEFKRLGVGDEGIKDGELCLPSNLYIYATMNTSDQSLFPIDSAFKRRWDWEYEPIKYKNTDWTIKIDDDHQYSWVEFQNEVNHRILSDTSSEDKMLGDYFVNPRDGVITKGMLLNKILFYLWNDVCKDGEGDIFKTGSSDEVTFSELYRDDKKLIAMMDYLKSEYDKRNPSKSETTTDTDTETPIE